MVMIPLHYLITLMALLFAAVHWFETADENRNRIFVGFLILLALQAAIVGTRFGYHVEGLGRIQPITAALLPPLAYLSFREGSGLRGYVIHLLPPVIAGVLSLSMTVALDAFLALNNLFYGILLARLGLRGGDGLVWATINQVRNWLIALWVVVLLLVYSGLTDSVISLDFILTSGRNTDNIVALSSIIGIAGTIAVGVLARWRSTSDTAKAANAGRRGDLAVFRRVDDLLRSERLFLDPDLNLNRVSRRLLLPARDVSRAINDHAGQNVSQYINTLRIDEACRLIGSEGASVTSAIYACGFNTKSNFNREFLRVTGKSPSEWRSLNASASTVRTSPSG